MRTERFFKCGFRGLRFFPGAFAAILLFALLNSCEDKPDYIGRDLLPNADDLKVSFDSTELVYGYTRVIDSIRSGYKVNHLLGSINDPFFGSSRAEILTTISSSLTSEGFGNNAVTDSVIFYISWSERLGEGESPLRLHLYEYNEILRYDSAYYTNMDMTGLYREPALGSAMLQPGDTSVRVYISDQEFIDKFLTAEDSILKSSEYLQELMYGLYLSTEDASDEGSILKINFDDPGNYLYFYYSNDTLDSLNQHYLLSNNANGRVNMFRHDPAGYPLEEYLQKGSDNDSLLFIQSMVGVSPVIRFPALDRWLDSMPVAINEARLILTLADTGLTLQHDKYHPGALVLYLLHPDGSVARVYDDLLDGQHFGGEFEEARQSYSFTLKAQFQSVLAGDVENLQMMLVPENTTENVNRAGLHGWSSNQRKRIRLEIIYTIL